MRNDLARQQNHIMSNLGWTSSKGDFTLIEDSDLAPGWAYFIEDGEPITFTLEDWADDPGLVEAHGRTLYVNSTDFDKIVDMLPPLN